MISVTGHALGGGDDSLVIGHEFALRAMAGLAVIDPGHEDIGGQFTLGGVMAVVAGDHLVFGVIEG